MIKGLIRFFNPSRYAKDDISKPLSTLKKGDTVYLLFMKRYGTNEITNRSLDLFDKNNTWVYKTEVVRLNIERQSGYNDEIRFRADLTDNKNTLYAAQKMFGGYGDTLADFEFSCKDIRKLLTYCYHASCDETIFQRDYDVYISTSKKKLVNVIKQRNKEVKWAYKVWFKSDDVAETPREVARKRYNEIRRFISDLKYQLALL
jgi:hypothetical protein